MSRFILYRVSQGASQWGSHGSSHGVTHGLSQGVSQGSSHGVSGGGDATGGNSAMCGDVQESNSVRLGVEPDACSVRCGDYVLRHYGSGYKQLGETGIYIGGYVLPRNSLFPAYGETGQHELVSRLYAEYGSSFTDRVKGRFVVIIMAAGQVEIYFDHLGLFRAFYCDSGEGFMMAGTVRQLAEAGVTPEPDRVSLAMQALFHRVPGRYTVYRNIFKTTGADRFTLHEGQVSRSRYFSPGNLLLPGVNANEVAADDFSRQASGREATIDDFSRLFLENVTNFNSYLRPEATFITLTGGKDSRTILAALLAAGIKPEGLTYGNNNSRDAVYAGMLAREAGIRHVVASPPATAEWHGKAAGDIIGTGDPEINIHRALRHYAFAGAAATAGSKCAFFTGYLGGELLMGIYHDDLIFTGFLKSLWDGASFDGLAEQRLGEYFIKADSQLVREAGERTAELACTDMSLSQKIREFHAIFEIGIPHHTQDVTLSSLFWDYPCPLYLDIEFLELLFRSRHSFLFRDASTLNPFKRHDLFSLNMGMQHRLFPGLDSVPFGKRGSYSNREYLRGPLLWSIVKGYRLMTERKKYPPSFAYGKEYGEFLAGVLDEAGIAGAPPAEFYDVPRAVTGLGKLEFPIPEKQLHKYSAIAALQMMYSNIG